MTIESKNFIATVEDIKELARSALGATAAQGTYLSALLGTAQAEIRGAKAQEEGSELKALTIVHKRFYAAVLEIVITPDLADAPRLKQAEKTRRSLERNRRSNFARSAYSTIRAWAKAAGHDLMALKPDKVTKAQLTAETPKRHTATRAPKPEKIQAKVDALVESLLNSTRQLAHADPVQARTVLDSAMQKLARELFQGAVQPTNDPIIAAKEHRPLKAANTMFWPTETQVIRRQRLKVAA
jgi:hypothetical protein